MSPNLSSTILPVEGDEKVFHFHSQESKFNVSIERPEGIDPYAAPEHSTTRSMVPGSGSIIYQVQYISHGNDEQ